MLFDPHRFYAFDELGGTPADEQLFKICRWLKAKDVVAHTENTTTKAYLVYNLKNKGNNFIIYYYDCKHISQLEEDLSHNLFDAHSCVIVEDIRHQASALWRQLIASPATSSTFDLANRGIAFFDPARQKQNYLL